MTGLNHSDLWAYSHDLTPRQATVPRGCGVRGCVSISFKVSVSTTTVSRVSSWGPLPASIWQAPYVLIPHLHGFSHHPLQTTEVNEKIPEKAWGTRRALQSCSICAHLHRHPRRACSYNRSHLTVDVATSKGHMPMWVGVKAPGSGGAGAQCRRAGLSCTHFLQARPSSQSCTSFKYLEGF